MRVLLASGEIPEDYSTVSDRSHISQWLKNKDTSPYEIEICHARGGRVEMVRHEEGESSDDFATRIFDIASEDASGGDGEGPQKYWLLLRRHGDSQSEARKPITVDPHRESVKSSDSPDEMGLTSQAMRHQEVNMKVLLSKVVEGMGVIQRENERLQAFQIEQDRMRSEQMVLQRTLANDVANQRVREAELFQQAERDKWLMRQVEILLPVGISKLFGGGVNWAEEGNILLELVKTLSPEQMGAIVSVLDPPSRIMLQELAGGGIAAPFIPLAVQRLMSTLTDDQYRTLDALMTSPEQKGIFRRLFAVRKQSLEWAETQPRIMPPRYGEEPHQLNGSQTEHKEGTGT